MQKSNNAESTQKKRLYRHAINISLLVFGIIMAFSGFYIQIRYHIQGDFPLGFSWWRFIHKWSALLFTWIVVIHIVIHLNWYKTVFRKRLLKSHRTTLVLSASMLIVSLLGFTPWILSLFPFHLDLRHTLIEIHDKIGVAFVAIMIGHIIKKMKWEPLKLLKQVL